MAFFTFPARVEDAARPPRAFFAHQKTVRLVVEVDMEVDAMSIINSLPYFSAEIVGVVPQFGGKCFDITLLYVDSVTQLATAAFDCLNTVKPLQLFGAPTIHVCPHLSGIPRQGPSVLSKAIWSTQDRKPSSPALQR